ncbi:hypothetical protein [Sansalvadorimonas verongulae]|uniref:hypothetical protein n=1 Tax=Sansalvadorimonas verongulae TaxID=2172824 RepID=UPI0012BC929C|nr:hypothetical protein [Sansalvadorimonas verongulae]MTI12121.1 hypothetical protein [Sansalvadorimonas verongulae]
MSKPKISHMIAYLQRIGVKLPSLDPVRVEAEYFRKIYKVQPRDKVLAKGQPIKRAKAAGKRHGVQTPQASP